VGVEATEAGAAVGGRDITITKKDRA